MKFRCILLTAVLLLCLAVTPAFAAGYGSPIPYYYTGAAVYVPAELTIRPLLVIRVNGVEDWSNDWIPGGVLTDSFIQDVTPVPGQEATYAESGNYEVWVYSNAPWAARIGRTAYMVRAGHQTKFENQIAQNNKLGFEYRKTDGTWQPLNAWSLTPIWDSTTPTGNDGQELGDYQFRGVIDSETTPGKYNFAVYFTAYQE